MSALIWDATGEKFYETGTDRGVVYPQSDSGTYPNGYAWNGLTAVNEAPSGAESNDLWADNQKYLSLISAEDFGYTIEAYYYPPEFEACDGTAEPTPGVKIGQQVRKPFGFCYRTRLGNDIKGDDYGYKLHLIYNSKASPSDQSYSTVNDSPEAISFSWECTTTPVNVTGYKPTAKVVVDSTRVDAAALKRLEEALYGTAGTDPYLPTPDQVIAMLGPGGATGATNG